MKFAFIIMDTNYAPEKDRAKIHNGAAQIIGVSDIDEACEAAQELYKSGIDCIELCGAFGETGAREIINATNNQIPIGYITHLPEQNELYEKAFR